MNRPRRIGRCIYCRTSQPPLSKEHIIPHGLIPAGDKDSWVLQAASCERCSAITSAFEGHVLGKVFQAARTVLGLRTRHGRPAVYTLTLERDGIFTEVRVPVADYPATILFPTFPPPAYLDSRRYVGGIEVNGQCIIVLPGAPLKSIAQRYGTKRLRFTTTFKGHSFPRLIAKVAYGVAVADFGLDGIETVYVLPEILGKSNNIGRWVGCDGRTQEVDPRYIHRVGHSVVNGEIISLVHLFARFGAPQYVAVVGRIAKGARPGKFSLPR